MILLVVFVVLMLFWLCFGCYWSWDATKPAGLGNTLIPWACVAILGWVVFGGGVTVSSARYAEHMAPIMAPMVAIGLLSGLGLVWAWFTREV